MTDPEFCDWCDGEITDTVFWHMRPAWAFCSDACRAAGRLIWGRS